MGRKKKKPVKADNPLPIPVFTRDVQGSHIKIYLFWDMHGGPVRSSLERGINEIKRHKNAYFILGGDNIEGIGGDDWRLEAGDYDAASLGAAIDTLPDVVGAQIRELADIISPVADRCLLILSGNHERKVRKRTGIDPNAMVAALLEAKGYNVPFTRAEVAGLVLRIFYSKNRDAHITYKIIAQHGSGGGSLPGGAINKALRSTMVFDGVDAIINGHTHHMSTTSTTKFRFFPRRDGGWALEPHPVVIIKPGSGRGYPNYAAQGNMLYSSPGWTILELRVTHDRETRKKIIEPRVIEVPLRLD